MNSRLHSAKIIFSFTLLLAFYSSFLFSQNDSLKALVNSCTSDTAKFRLCNQLSVTYSTIDNKSAVFFANQAKQIAEKRNDKLGISEALNNLGYALYYTGENDSAITIYHQSIKLAREAHDSDNVIFALNRLGFSYREKGDFPKALIFYNQALASNKNEKNISEAAYSYLNIGVVYSDENNPKDALRYEERGMELYKKTGEEARIANCLARIGNTYLDMKDSTKAMDFYEQSMAMFTKSNNPRGVAICLNNIANLFKGKKEMPKAIEYYNRALEIREKIGDKNGTALVCNNLGTTYKQEEQYEKAIYYLNKSLTIAREIGFVDEMKSDYLSLSETYEELGDDKKALDFYKKFFAMNDSMFNVENNKQVNELNAKFDTERRQKELESISKEKDLIAVAYDQQTKRTIFMVCALLLVLVLVIVVWRNARKSKRANEILQKQKNEISNQKKIVDEQNRDIIDSINYAKRIQNAVLPSQDEMQIIFANSFVYFRPRDIVSGDFWWIGQQGNIKIIAVADCTGHGVPGAFMSLIGNTGLNEVVKEKHISNPGEILNHLAQNIVAALKQDNKEIAADDYSMGLVKDGMDIAIICIDEEKGELKFAGANNPIYYVSNNEIHEIKGDRQPVGIFTKELKPFTVHTLSLKELEAVYIFTDGYADQFGGETGKKFKYSQLKELLFTIHKKTTQEQEQELDEALKIWKGKLDQVDDILVAGIKFK